MAYSEQQKIKIVNNICNRIKKGDSLRKALEKENNFEFTTFYSWLDKDKEKSKQYTRAMEVRAEDIFEEIITISDNNEHDEMPFVGINHIHRDRLKVDSRKWMLSKMVPKKYGDKLEIETRIEDKRKTIDQLFPTNEELNQTEENESE